MPACTPWVSITVRSHPSTSKTFSDLKAGKQYEGSLYPNTTSGDSPKVQEQDAVPPGGCAVYKWLISDSQAPAPGQPSRLWSYHSFVNMPADTSAGMSGPIIVYNSGKMNATMASHREFVVTTNTHYESKSFLAGVNARNGGVNTSSMRATNQLVMPHVGNESFWVPQLANFPEVLLSDAQGPNFYTMNEYVFGNGAPYEMCRNDPVLWYVMVSFVPRPLTHLIQHADCLLRPLAAHLTSFTCTATTSSTSTNGKHLKASMLAKCSLSR